MVEYNVNGGDAMSEVVQFCVVVGADRVIRLPAGVVLPEGEVEVTVRPVGETEVASKASLDATRRWMLEFAREAELANPGLPADLARNHDFYAAGKAPQ
jgi:hypothetical protein